MIKDRTGAVDLHVHLAPLLPDDVAEPGVGREGGKLVIDGHAVGPAALYAPEALVEHLDARALAEAAVSVPPPFFRQDLDAVAALGWVAAVNDGLLAAVAPHDRLLPLAYLPLEHPELALEEAARRAGDPRWAGFCASAGGGSISLADGRLSGLWRRLDAAQALLLLHPGRSPDHRLEEFYLHNLLGNPVETALAAAQLVFGDVLATHPRMRVLLVHCGGCVPDVVARWDHGVATRRPGLRPLSEPPSRAVRRMFVDCLAHDPGAVDRAVATFGEDRMVLGSDWPFPMGADDPFALVAHRGAQFVHTVACTNGARALGRPA